MEDVYLQHEFIWLFRCNIIIIFCKIGASQLDTPVATLDLSQLHTHAQTIEYIFFQYFWELATQ